MGWLIGRIFAEELQFAPTTDTLYSDLGFILLGRVIEIASGESLDRYWRRKICCPLHLENDLFFAGEKEKVHRIYVPTGNCGWSNKSLYGYVNDDNCRALGGIAGHAGLFGTVGGVLNLCKEILLCYHGQGTQSPFTSKTLRTMLENREGEWLCGFDSPTPPLSSSGKFFSDKTIGHLGFTGTSFWIDLQQQIIIVLLTNRVFCGDQLSAIQRFRPMVHDLIMDYIK
jgi:CubicO group peptidase (beta-lactamase class C family)